MRRFYGRGRRYRRRPVRRYSIRRRRYVRRSYRRGRRGLNYTLKRVRVPRLGEGTRTTANLYFESTAPGAGLVVPNQTYALYDWKVNDQFPVTNTVSETSPGYQNFRMFAQLYRRYRVRSVNVRVEFFSVSAPATTAPDIYTIDATPYNPASQTFAPDGNTRAIIQEMPSSKTRNIIPNNVANRKAIFKFRLRPAAILGLTEREYMADPQTGGQGMGFAVPTDSTGQTYVPPGLQARLAFLLYNGSTTSRTFNYKVSYRSKIDFYQGNNPMSVN